jgi:hypothetical protein
MGNEIAFTARLTEADWDEELRAWRCPALNIPSAVVEDIIVDGNRVDRTHYEVRSPHAMIHWILADRPDRLAAIIKLTEPLSLGKETDKWKKLAVVLPVVATVIAALVSGVATYFARQPSTSSSAIPQVSATGPNSSVPKPSVASISENTQFSVDMPRGDKVIVIWNGDQQEEDGAEALKKAGISLVDVDEGTKIAYSALTKKSKDSISYIPFFVDGKLMPGYSQVVVNAGPAANAGYEEFQLFQRPGQFTIVFEPLTEKLPTIAPEKIGVDWDKVRTGLRQALVALYRGKKDFEFDGVSVVTKPNGSWEFLLEYRER